MFLLVIHAATSEPEPDLPAFIRASSFRHTAVEDFPKCLNVTEKQRS